ncbi:MAG: FecCD family ABC transporter permease, partial [Burkholderiaceae bacterium]
RDQYSIGVVELSRSAHGRRDRKDAGGSKVGSDESAQVIARALPTLTSARPHSMLVGVLVLLLLLLFAASLIVGHTPLNLGSTLQELLRSESTISTLILIELRLPRTLLAGLVGASLGLAGAAMQGLLRNPLAEPGIIGVSACAAFGAVLAFYSGLSLAAPLSLPLAGIAGALLAVVLLYALAGRDASTLTLILAGVAINGFAGAATALALNLAPNPFAVTELVFWMMGSVADRSLVHVQLAAPLMIVGWVLLLTGGRALDALTLGEDTAASLGVRLGRVRLMLIVGTALAVGSGVAVTGTVGFVGLVAPHLMRPFVAHQPSRLLIVSALSGAALVLAADIAIRMITIGPELKLGVVTALIGAPFFLVLLMRLRREVI